MAEDGKTEIPVYRRSLVALTLLLLATVAPIGGGAVPKKPAGRIIFERCDAPFSLPCRGGIWSVNADGTGLKALATDGQEPVWSAHGRHIFYVHDIRWPGNLPPPHAHLPKGWQRWSFPLELYQVDSDGSDWHLIRRFDGEITGVVPSPDGKYLAGGYFPTTTDVWGIFVMPLAGKAEPHLLFKKASWPGWSPVGDKLAFSRAITATGNSRVIEVANADGSRERQLTHWIGSGWTSNALSPAWSPDGKEIAFENSMEGRGDAAIAAIAAVDSQIFVVNATGSGLRQLTTDPSLNCGSLVWSPDGKWIAFGAEKTRAYPYPLRGVTMRHLIFLIRPNGRGLRQLTDNTNWNCFHPSWSPDGSEIAFSCSAVGPACSPGPGGVPVPGNLPPNCVRRIFVMRTSDPGARPIQIAHVDGWSPSFSPVP